MMSICYFISFSNIKFTHFYGLCGWLLSYVRLFATPWTAACKAPPSMGILQARILEWVAMPSSNKSSQPRDRTQVSCFAGEQAGFSPSEPPGKASLWFKQNQIALEDI